MLTRRKLLTNGVPAVAAFTAVGIVAATPQQESLESLLDWAKEHGCYVHVYDNGHSWVWTPKAIQYGWKGDTLREALLKARAEIEIGEQR